MMLRSVLNGRFRQLPGKKDLDPMRREGSLARFCANTDDGKSDR
jgi:hypothetical protein